MARLPLHMEENNYNNKTTTQDVLIPLLAKRSCHLPGNTWTADWIQWFRNNHILFGICLHHRLHPLEGWERCLLLSASISFGLVATNIVYQMETYISGYDDNHMMDNTLMTYGNYTITNGMVVLWTLGGLCHSIFDMLLWHIMACACCHPGGRWGDSNASKRYKDCGSYALIPVILGLLGVAVFFVLIRASDPDVVDDQADQAEQQEGDDAQDTDIDIDSWRSFSFLSQYAIEIALAWFLYFPLVGTLVFSGVLGCDGRLPVLGGRPRDLKRVEEGRVGLFNQSQRSNYSRF